MIKKIGLFGLIFTFTAFLAEPSHAESSKKIVVAVPLISQLVKKEADGQWHGPLISVLQSLEKKADMTFEKRVLPFKRAVAMTKEGQADFGVFMESPKRNKMALPVKKLGEAIYVIVSLRKNQITSLDQLEGKTVAQIRGGTEVKSLAPIKNLQYHRFNKHEDGIRLLKSGRVDALLTADFRILEAIERLKLSYNEIARPVPVEGRGLWLYWSWRSSLDFKYVKRLKETPEITIEGLDPGALFDEYSKGAN